MRMTPFEKSFMEYMGFFVVQEGLDPLEFRILETHEMSAYANKKLEKAKKILESVKNYENDTN
jgi:hypothetical protein